MLPLTELYTVSVETFESFLGAISLLYFVDEGKSTVSATVQDQHLRGDIGLFDQQ